MFFLQLQRLVLCRHHTMEDLVDYAHDFDRWSIWTNAILDPELDPEHA